MNVLETNYRHVLCMWLLFMGIFGFTQTFAQLPLLEQAEYFYDIDPGYGNGFDIPVETNTRIDVTFEMDVSELSTGLHKVYFRTKNENDVWSLTNVTEIYVEEIQQNPQPLPAIVYAEYFLDSDPGEGNGINIPVGGGTEIDIDFEIDLEGISTDFHKAYLRTKDENNVWSLTNVTDIFVEEIQQNPQPLPAIVSAEYFLDTDPGEGNGITIPVAGGAETDIDFEIDLETVSLGFHKAYLRTMDENNVWSLTNITDIYVEEIQQTPQPLPAIVYAECFLDTDPGEGNGINIPIAGGEEIDIDFEISLAGVSAGFHKAYLRTKDENNAWSLSNIMDIYVMVNYNTLHINIPAGWSGISTNVIPNDPSVENIFAPLDDEMVILQNFEGMYWPYAGVNTIGNWNDMDGYQVKMETEQQVTFTGTIQDNLVSYLTAGWNYLPVLNRCNNNCVNLFVPIINHLQIVKEVAGTGVYWPQFGVNTLGELAPGKAYFVLVDEEVELEFPVCTPASKTPSNSPYLCAIWP